MKLQNVHYTALEHPFSITSMNNQDEELLVFGDSITELVGSFIETLEQLADYQTYELRNGLNELVCRGVASHRARLVAS